MSPTERPDLRLQQRDYLLRIARAMTARLELEGVLTLVIQSAVEMAHGKSGAIALRQADGSLRVAVRYGLVPQVNLDLGQSPGDPSRQLPPPADPPTAGATLVRRAREIAPELDSALSDAQLEATDGARLSVVGVEVEGEHQQMMALPLSAAGEELGMILVFRSEGASVFTPLDSELLDAFADQAAVAIHNARLHARLQASERQLETVVEHDPSGVLLASADGRVQLDNPALRLLVGGPADVPLVGRALAEILQLEDEAGRGLPLDLPTAASPESAAPAEVRGYVRRLDGTRGPFVQATITAAGPPGSIGDSYLADVVDLSAFKEAEDAKSTFLAGLSHELKTPLALIRGYAETLQMPGARTDETLFDDAVEVILDETDHLTSMVDQLLTAAQWQAGGLRLRFDEVDVGGLLRRLVDQFTVAHPDRDWRLTLAPDLPTVMADPTRLREVFQNLLTNAWKYSEPDTEIRVVAVDGTAAEVVEGTAAEVVDGTAAEAVDGTAAEVGVVTISVTDHGPGIASEDQARVFERFVRATDRSEGTGLGLYTSRAIVEAHGGTLTLMSAPAEGSTFTVRLPVAGEVLSGDTEGRKIGR